MGPRRQSAPKSAPPQHTIHYVAAVVAIASVFAGYCGMTWFKAARDPFANALVPATSDSPTSRLAWQRQLTAHSRQISAVEDLTPPPDAAAREERASTPTGHAKQLALLGRHQAVVPTVVSRTDKGLALFYVGEAPLPAGAIVSLYRCSLFVRADLIDEWIESGAMAKDDATVSFWAAYSIRLQPEAEADESRISVGHHGGHAWSCFPVGEAPSDGWWTPHGWGPLDEARIAKALRAHADHVLADWSTGRRWIHPVKGVYHTMTGHVMNEPSGEEDPTVSRLDQVAPCAAFGGEDGASLRVCSTVITAHARREIQPGEELVWCYGGQFQREGYAVGQACGEGE